MKRAREGMVLLNVLMVVAICAAAVTVMIVAQDVQVRRTVRLHEAAQAQAYARAGEQSALAALRRDAATAADLDTLSEPWAGLAQQAIAVPGGTFSLAVADEQARFNVNALIEGGPVAANALLEIAKAARVDRRTVARIDLALRALGPLSDDGPLRAAGVDAGDLDRLAPWIVFLPPEAKLNVNTADPALLTMILRDPAEVRRLVERRRQSGVSATDAEALGSGGLFGATSSHFVVAVDVRVGGVRRATVSRITRRLGDDGQAQAFVSGRRRVRVP